MRGKKVKGERKRCTVREAAAELQLTVYFKVSKFIV